MFLFLLTHGLYKGSSLIVGYPTWFIFGKFFGPIMSSEASNLFMFFAEAERSGIFVNH